MRRTRAAGEDEASLPELRSHHGVVPDRTRSISPAAKLVAVLIFVWGLYISVVALGKGRGGTATGETTVAVRGENVGGRGYVVGRRGGLRELNMLGFEKGSGDGGKWRTCRAYQEDKLAKDKIVGGSKYLCVSRVLDFGKKRQQCMYHRIDTQSVAQRCHKRFENSCSII